MERRRSPEAFFYRGGWGGSVDRLSPFTEEARERAEEQLRQSKSIQEHSHFEASLARSLARLRLKHKYEI